MKVQQRLLYFVQKHDQKVNWNQEKMGIRKTSWFLQLDLALLLIPLVSTENTYFMIFAYTSSNHSFIQAYRCILHASFPLWQKHGLFDHICLWKIMETLETKSSLRKWFFRDTGKHHQHWNWPGQYLCIIHRILYP